MWQWTYYPTEFSESLIEMGNCLLDKTAMHDDGERGECQWLQLIGISLLFIEWNVSYDVFHLAFFIWLEKMNGYIKQEYTMIFNDVMHKNWEID